MEQGHLKEIHFPDYKCHKKDADFNEQDIDAVKEYIKNSLTAPKIFEKEILEQYEELGCLIFLIWVNVCHNYKIDRETTYIRCSTEETDFELDEDDLLIELLPAAQNISRWIECAKKDFIDILKPITVEVADKNIYSKHFLISKNSDIKELSSKSNISYLASHITASVLKDIYLSNVNKVFFKLLKTRDSVRFSVKEENVVGYSGGVETNYLMFEVNTSSGITHAYPVSEIEAIKLPACDIKYDSFTDICNCNS